MNRTLIIAICFALAATIGSAQEKQPQNQEVDSLKMNLEEEGVMVVDTLVTKKRRINPLAPSKAAFYSAVLPGLGQIYNKRYWKVPIVYAAIGTGIYAYTFNDGRYNRFRDAFKRRRAGFTDDEFYDLDGSGIDPGNPDFSDDALEDAQERFQRDRDLALLITILLYALNVVDANVDAHLKQYNIDDDLSFNLDIQPYIDLNPITTDPNYGLALTIKF
ncbi:DUF5683 domain-containing protein [Ulvibacterium marinum]|uniref:DUF5683 domain-containing protein n=1 Tax=Ulvibacterium marinum TaxID=2419782 RepID=UPI003CD0E086